MVENMWEKYRAEREKNLNKGPKHGKQINQKLKPYLVLQYLLKYSDENNTRSACDIIGYLEGCGISAERRSIYRDIEDINRIMLMLQEDIDLEEVDMMFAEVEESGDEDALNDLRMVVYDKSKKGFYVRQRNFDVDDIRLLAECVYSAKFLSKGQSERLARVVCDFVSEQQAESIRYDALLTDRVKTQNKSVIHNVAAINEAMSRKVNGKPHEPEQISFQYLKYELGDLEHQVERRHGGKYIVSPFKLLINDGNYYLLCYDSKKQKIWTYRVDRMKNVQCLGIPREGKEAFDAIDLKTYTQRVFSMFGGQEQRVTVQFINPLLDTVIERFGADRSYAQYVKTDDHHFTVTAKVAISDQFFGWILGFGKKAKLLEPDDVVEQFKAYMDKIRETY